MSRSRSSSEDAPSIGSATSPQIRRVRAYKGASDEEMASDASSEDRESVLDHAHSTYFSPLLKVVIGYRSSPGPRARKHLLRRPGESPICPRQTKKAQHRPHRRSNTPILLLPLHHPASKPHHRPSLRSRRTPRRQEGPPRLRPPVQARPHRTLRQKGRLPQTLRHPHPQGPVARPALRARRRPCG